MQIQNTEESGIVLSGGGVRGMAHIGVLRALKEHGIMPKWVAGTSVGALVGALYASGKDTQEMLSFFSETPLFKYNFFSINKPGLLNTERYHAIFREFWPENSFESLHRPLFVVATDLLKGGEVIFNKGELIPPLLASAALPPIFSPVEINSTLYADGGIMNNFPLEPLVGKARYLIGSNVSVVKELTNKNLRTSFQLANRTTALMIYAINRGKIRQCDLVFEPVELEKIGVLDKKGITNAYTIGYEHAMRILENEEYQTSS